nr:hypothetical protein [Tanacetum cinerariifolium]
SVVASADAAVNASAGVGGGVSGSGSGKSMSKKAELSERWGQNMKMPGSPLPGAVLCLRTSALPVVLLIG